MQIEWLGDVLADAGSADALEKYLQAQGLRMEVNEALACSVYVALHTSIREELARTRMLTEDAALANIAEANMMADGVCGVLVRFRGSMGLRGVDNDRQKALLIAAARVVSDRRKAAK